MLVSPIPRVVPGSGRPAGRVGSGWVGSGPEYGQERRVGSGLDPSGSGRVGSKYPDPT